MQSATICHDLPMLLIWDPGMLVTVYFYFNLSPLVGNSGWALMLCYWGVAVTWWSSEWTSRWGSGEVVVAGNE